MKINLFETMLNEDKTPYLTKTERNIKFDGRKNVSDPIDIANIAFALNCHKLTEEYSYCLCLNNKNKPIGIFEISHGNVNTSIMNPREIFQKALLIGATNIALWHNHPSGDITPSRADITCIEKLKECCDIMKITLLDHVIVGYDEGKNYYYSFAEDGLI